MRIAVIGAGIVGVTTAFELAGDGHDVTVYERRGSVAAETSFANAGVVAPGYVTPWAAPGMRGKVLRSLVFDRHGAVRVNARLDVHAVRWMLRWWRACSGTRYAANRAAMQRLALFSRERLRQVTHQLRLEYERSDGFLVLLRSAQDLALAQPGLALLKELGLRHSVLDAAGCAGVEPGLSPETPLHAGIHLPDDEIGNCRQFAHLLRGEAQARGVRFRFHAQVQRIVPGRRPELVLQAAPADESGPFASMDSSRTGFAPTQPMQIQPVTETVDAIVVCAALGSAELLAPHGLRLPMTAVFGYSVTAPMRQPDAHGVHGARSGVMDERYKVAISRLGSRVRVAGSAELGGSPATHNPAALETLYKVLDDWFPGAARLSQAQRWKGARPMLPDGPPVLGRSGIEGVWLNLGHGSSGWALACGSARVLADAMASRPPPVDTAVFGVERLAR
jgi:D-amino-acid dehydrogenase